MRFNGKYTVVTGGAARIGRSVAEGFLREGATVAVIDTDRAKGEAFADEYPGRVYFFCGDVGEKETLESFAAWIRPQFPRVDLLVNNAGIGAGGVVSGCSYEDFLRIQRVNLAAPYYLTLLLRDCFPEKGGAIVNVSSIRAFQSQPDTEAYTASKGGVLSLTHALAMSFRGRIRVNCVTPAWIRAEDTVRPDTPLYGTTTLPDHLQYPVGHVGYPHEVAAAIMFLCSEDASFITGENLMLDGGCARQFIQHEDFGWRYDPIDPVKGPH
ncbi:MAG: SDR family oxidoreductase [Clostridiaceae bacterium]|nr:SDR family oxidoreductase [Clostridiaceae bacterium]